MWEHIMRVTGRIAGLRSGRILATILSGAWLIVAMIAAFMITGLSNVLLVMVLLGLVGFLAYWGMSRIMYLLD